MDIFSAKISNKGDTQFIIGEWFEHLTKEIFGYKFINQNDKNGDLKDIKNGDYIEVKSTGMSRYCLFNGQLNNYDLKSMIYVFWKYTRRKKMLPFYKHFDDPKELLRHIAPNIKHGIFLPGSMLYDLINVPDLIEVKSNNSAARPYGKNDRYNKFFDFKIKLLEDIIYHKTKRPQLNIGEWSVEKSYLNPLKVLGIRTSTINFYKISYESNIDDIPF